MATRWHSTHHKSRGPWFRFAQQEVRPKKTNDPKKLGDPLLSCKLIGRCQSSRLTSWGLSEVSASFSHLWRRGFSLHMFLKLSWRASKRQMVVWLNILPTHKQISHSTISFRIINLKAQTIVRFINASKVPICFRNFVLYSWQFKWYTCQIWAHLTRCSRY